MTIYFLIALVFILFSCKKKDNDINKTSGSAANTNQTTDTIISSGFPATGANNVMGVFKADKANLINFGGIIQYSSEAGFSNTGKPFNMMYYLAGVLSGGVFADSVWINTTVLKYDSASPSHNNRYIDTTNNPVYNNVTWTVKGNSQI